MFPTNRKITGYTYGQKTFYSDFHTGTDYAKENDPVYAPFNGSILKLYGTEGGNTIWFYPEGKKEMIRFLHLQKILKVGKVKEGEKIAVVGHTGLVRPPGIAGSHTHIDISKNGKLELNNKSNFQNPETYKWESLTNDGTMFRTYNKTIYLLVAGYWLAVATSYEQFLQDFGGVTAPEMTEDQFRAFLVTRPTIK